MRTRATLLGCVLACSAAACGGGDDARATADAGTSDGGRLLDGGGTSDGGRALDGGGTSDGGRALDGGGTSDGGRALDGSSSTDAGGAFDAGPDGCDAAARWYCVDGVPGGECSDIFTEPVCVKGSWACLHGIDERLCACSGYPPGLSCVCTTRGWACHALADGGALTCVGIRDPSACFACGPALQCASGGSEYCEVVTGGPSGSEARYSCLPVPFECRSTPTCACIVAAHAGWLCAEDAEGNVTLQFSGP